MQSIRAFIKGFYEGLTEISSGSLLIAVTTIVLLVFSIVPDVVLRIPPDYLTLGRNDFDTQVTNRALHLQSSKKLAVTLIGASSLLYGSLEEKSIGAQLAEKVGRQIEVYKLAFPSRNLWDIAIFADQIPETYRGVIVICFGLEDNPAEILRKGDWKINRFPLSSPLYDTKIKQANLPLPYRSGIYFLDNFGYYSRRFVQFLKAVLFSPTPASTDTLDAKNIFHELPKERKERQEIIVERVNNYRQHADQNFSFLAEVFSRLRNERTRLVYLMPPRNIDYLQPIYDAIDENDYLTSIAQDSARQATNSNVMFWNFNDSRLFKYGDFADFCHINNEQARANFTDILTDHLAELINEELRK